MTAKGMVCLALSVAGVYRDVLWAVGVSEGVCLGLLGCFRPLLLLHYLPPGSSPFS